MFNDIKLKTLFLLLLLSLYLFRFCHFLYTIRFFSSPLSLSPLYTCINIPFIHIPRLSFFLDGVDIIVNKYHEQEQVMPSLNTMMQGARAKNTTLVLAKERTRRKDFFNGFQRYTGGWNITNVYYLTVIN